MVRTVNLNTGWTSYCDLELRSDGDEIAGVQSQRRRLTVITVELHVETVSTSQGVLDTVRLVETVAGSAGQGGEPQGS